MALDRLTEVHFRLPGCQRCENGARVTRSPGWGITWPIVKQVHDATYMASLCLKWVQFLSYVVDIKLADGLVLSALWLSAGMALDKVILYDFPSLNSKIEIHDSQCNLRRRAINISKIFWGLTTFWKWQVVNTVKWHWRHDVFNHGQLDCLSDRLFRLTTKQIQKLHTTEFCGNHLSPVVSPHKWVGDAGIVIDIMTVTQHIIAQYGDINLSTLTPVMACCRTEPNHYLNQFWLIIGKVQWGDTSAIIY